jgi:hypothetical protein
MPRPPRRDRLPAEYEDRQVAPIADLRSSLVLIYHLGIGRSYARQKFFTSKTATPRLESVAWSSADVLSQTIHKLDNLGLRHELLPEWYDIDTANEWGACSHKERTVKLR